MPDHRHPACPEALYQAIPAPKGIDPSHPMILHQSTSTRPHYFAIVWSQAVVFVVGTVDIRHQFGFHRRADNNYLAYPPDASHTAFGG
jgi:hypothetical protein